jgi:Ca2+-binding RTX toxin-like protein
VGAPAVRANLGTETLRLGDSPNRSTLISIENIETGTGDDSINGSAADNFIQPGGGDNVVYAGSGNDTIVGGSETNASYTSRGIELLNGGAGDDEIFGMGSHFILDTMPVYDDTPGHDVFEGGDGNDTLYGGAAVQTMTGGSGRDVFVLTDEEVYSHYRFDTDYFATTTITDYERGQDVIRLEFAARFVGAVDPADLEVGELGYRQNGGDTILEVRFNDDDENGYEHEDSVLTIILSNYTGPLSANDFDLG